MTAIRIIGIVLSCIAICFSTFSMIWTFTKYEKLIKKNKALEKKIKEYEQTD